MTIDLRSDTFTKPSAAMLHAMYTASVGDDVFGEDPTVNKLEAVVAEMFAMQAALFCPSGTMTNQIAIKCHTEPGDEVICEKLSHVYIYEGGGIALNSSCQVSTIDGNRGMITAEQVAENINPQFDYKARTRLVSLENTTNRGGGSCYDFTEFELIKEVCLEYNLKLHLDGARIWNALSVKKENSKNYGSLFDSISVCLSKGLGAPVGSLLIGSKEFIQKARRVRKVFGGGMRQAGYLAAAGLFALENNIQLIEKDHEHVRMIAAALAKKKFIGNIMPIETNILIFEVIESYTAESFTSYLASQQILVMPVSAKQVRMVTHLDVTDEMVLTLLQLIESMN